MRFLEEDDLNLKRLLPVKVVLKQVSLVDCYAMQNENPNVTSIDDDPHDRFCVVCWDSLKDQTYIRCRECDNATLCYECFSMGAESGDHKRDHNYEINDPQGLPVFDSDGLPCGYNMELEMLAAYQNYKTETWEPEGIDLRKVDPTDLVYQRIDEHFLHGNIGRYIMKTKKWPILKEVDPSLARQAEEGPHVVDEHVALAESIALHDNGDCVMEDPETSREAKLCIHKSGQVFSNESPLKKSYADEAQVSNGDDNESDDGIVGCSFGSSPRKYSISFSEDYETESDTRGRMKVAKEEAAERMNGSPTRGRPAEPDLSESGRASRQISQPLSPRLRECGSGMSSPARRGYHSASQLQRNFPGGVANRRRQATAFRTLFGHSDT
ncbi:CBN-ADA-2 protein [Aphelenchoides avenae]|nr:CBN-ADA-2 protein [Aphelenchus avenae]